MHVGFSSARLLELLGRRQARQMTCQPPVNLSPFSPSPPPRPPSSPKPIRGVHPPTRWLLEIKNLGCCPGAAGLGTLGCNDKRWVRLVVGVHVVLLPPQMEMVITGKMHNYLRMYWAKQVIQWTPDLDTAFAFVLAQNNKWELDGRGANGFAGCAWSFGNADKSFPDRPIFGCVCACVRACVCVCACVRVCVCVQERVSEREREGAGVALG